MRKSLTDVGVKALKPRAKTFAFPDPELRGHYVRITPTGAKAFVTVTRNPNGKQVWTTIADCNVLSIDEARARARQIIQRIREGLPAIEAKAETFADVATNWLGRHVMANGLRTAPEIKRILHKFILPAWGDREFVSIRRSDIAKLMDKVQDHHGARQADTVLETASMVMYWYATRHDTYAPPVIRGMKRQKKKAQARSRILSDDEIRKLWKLAPEHGTFGAVIQIALLTAQRRDKIVSMKWSDIDDGVWTVPTDKREKGNIGSVALPRMALDIINAQPQFVSNEFVFAGRGAGHFDSMSKPKMRLDSQLKIPAWRFH